MSRRPHSLKSTRRPPRKRDWAADAAPTSQDLLLDPWSPFARCTSTWLQRWKPFDAWLATLLRRLSAAGDLVLHPGCLNKLRAAIQEVDSAGFEGRFAEVLPYLIPEADQRIFDSLARLGANQIPLDWSPDCEDVEPTLWHFMEKLLWAALLAPFWVRSPHAWSAPLGAPQERLRSFWSHLFVLYPIPEFLFNFLGGSANDAKWTMWIILLGRGISLRSCAGDFGWRISSGMWRQLWRVPHHLQVDQVTQWAEVACHAGSELEFTRMRDLWFEWDPTEVAGRKSFFYEGLRWLILHRDTLTNETWGMISWWALHLATEQEREGRAFSWKGRSPASLLRGARAYQRALPQPVGRFGAAHVAGKAPTWSGHNWDWQQVEQGGAVWSVRELTSMHELAEEGVAMDHCVASYAAECASGRTAIFSCRLNGQRILTLEVDPCSLRIRQARGARNRPPSAAELRLVDLWRLERIVRSPGPNYPS